MSEIVDDGFVDLKREVAHGLRVWRRSYSMLENDEMLYVIRTNEDGEVSIHEFSSEEGLNQWLDDEEEPNFKTFPLVRDLNNESGYLIIRGKWIQPKAKEVVSTWDFSNNE
jgi:hypothetical protein